MQTFGALLSRVASLRGKQAVPHAHTLPPSSEFHHCIQSLHKAYETGWQTEQRSDEKEGTHTGRGHANRSKGKAAPQFSALLLQISVPKLKLQHEFPEAGMALGLQVLFARKGTVAPEYGNKAWSSHGHHCKKEKSTGFHQPEISPSSAATHFALCILAKLLRRYTSLAREFRGSSMELWNRSVFFAEHTLPRAHAIGDDDDDRVRKGQDH